MTVNGVATAHTTVSLDVGDIASGPNTVVESITGGSPTPHSPPHPKGGGGGGFIRR